MSTPIEDDAFWLAETGRVQARYEAGGHDAATARLAAEQEVTFRRAVAGKRVTFTFPGEVVEDVDGVPVGMTLNSHHTTEYDGRGTTSAEWLNRTENTE